MHVFKARFSIYLVFCIAFAYTSAFSQNTHYLWDYQAAKKYAETQNDSTKWNMELLKKEGEPDTSHYLPIQVGVFPVAHYKSPGNGSVILDFEIEGKKIKGQATFIGRGEQNDYVFKKQTQTVEVPFIILAITNQENTGPTLVTSRNHPNYLAEGRIPANGITVDWLSMQLADRNAYAVVNMRLFDLRFGRIVIACPQKDNTLRFLQVETHEILLDGKDMPTIIQNLKAAVGDCLQKEEVSHFIKSFAG